VQREEYGSPRVDVIGRVRGGEESEVASLLGLGRGEASFAVFALELGKKGVSGRSNRIGGTELTGEGTKTWFSLEGSRGGGGGEDSAEFPAPQSTVAGRGGGASQP